MTRPSSYSATLAQAFEKSMAKVAPIGINLPIRIDRPKNRSHGDFSCNIAMQLAKPMKRKPKEIADQIIEAFEPPSFVERTEPAGPGFINVTLSNRARLAVVNEIMERGADYGRGAVKPGRTLIEFVSANPTGPVHIGHGRQAAHGSSLARILRFSGHETVACEYYINDSGRQIQTLGLTLWLRYLQNGKLYSGNLPADCYAGDYMTALACSLRKEHGDRFDRNMGEAAPETDGTDDWIRCAREQLGDEFDVLSDYARDAQLEGIRSDLDEFGTRFDTWTSEQTIWKSGRVEEALGMIERKGLLYEKDGAQWFRSTKSGDEKDRVVRRGNGEPTYFAADFGYHLDKYKRGYDTLILEVGQDHHGYQPRMKAMVAGLGHDPESLEIKMFAMVRLFRNGKAAKLTTRGGKFVSLRELVERVGRDAARFTYLTRRSNQMLDFDIELATRKTAENPVYYVQYAHARICSVMRQWDGDEKELAEADCIHLDHELEHDIARHLLDFGDAVELAARDREPHIIAFYLQELAASLHGYYNQVPFLDAPEPVRLARLVLIAAVRSVLASALGLLGVSAPDRM